MHDLSGDPASVGMKDDYNCKFWPLQLNCHVLHSVSHACDLHMLLVSSSGSIKQFI